MIRRILCFGIPVFSWGCGSCGGDEDAVLMVEEPTVIPPLAVEAFVPSPPVDFASLRGTGSGSTAPQSVSDEPVWSRIPSSAEAVLVIRELDVLIQRYREYTSWGAEVEDSVLDERIEALGELTGFDLIRSVPWSDSVFDVSRPWVLAYHDRDLPESGEDLSMALMIPLIEGTDSLSGFGIQEPSRGTAAVCSPDVEEPICMDDQRNALVFSGEHAVLVFGDETLASSYASPGASLATKDSFVRLYEQLGTDWTMASWVSADLVDAQLEENLSRRQFQELEARNQRYGSGEGTGLWGAAAVVRIAQETADFDFVSGADWMDHYAQFLGGNGVDRLATTLGGSAFAHFRIHQDMRGVLEYLSTATEDIEDWELVRDAIESPLQISLDDDVFGNLDGNISVSMLGGESDGLLVYLGLRDEEIGRSLLSRVFSQLGVGLEDLLQETEVDGNTWYTLDVLGYEVGITIAEEHLVVASGFGEGGVASAQIALRESSGSLLGNFDTESVELFDGEEPYAGLIDATMAIRMLLSEDGLLESLGLGPRRVRRAQRILAECIGDLTLMGGLAEDALLGVGRLNSARSDSGFGPCVDWIVPRPRPTAR